MTDLELVRTYISDNKQYGVSEAVGDGGTIEFLTGYAPIVTGTTKAYVDGTLVNSPSDYTIDESTGLAVFTMPPGTGKTVAISCYFTLLADAPIQAIMDTYAGSSDPVKLTAADCLDIIASSEALIQKKIEMLDVKIDGPALAKSLRDHAASLRDLVFNPKYTEAAFEVIELIYDPQSYLEKRMKDFQREGC